MLTSFSRQAKLSLSLVKHFNFYRQHLHISSSIKRPETPRLALSQRSFITMSDSEASDFHYDDNESDGFVPEPAVKKAAPKKASATKAAKVGDEDTRQYD